MGLGSIFSCREIFTTLKNNDCSLSDEETEEFGSPLDLGPSLMDEVFSELENYDTLRISKGKVWKLGILVSIYSKI